ncbi:unnamed protein product [Mytilus coruscus]|uniref:Uncharacterized protein n=1 Tax=Mytilus coruscus TaxID=42192 RepID=A0A6J8BNV0_MYTCO|nr:unnamed protein product [Mytilus coruscus]
MSNVNILSLDLHPANVHKTHGGKKGSTSLIKYEDELIPIVTPRLNQSQGSKRVAAGPIVTTSDEESDSLPPSPRSNDTSLNQNREACEHDHDYENVASPSGSSTASGPTYERPPGFKFHAHEIKKTKKKKTSVYFGDFKGGLKKRAPTPPKVKPRRDSVPMRLRALPQSFWKQPNCPSNVSPGNLFPSLPPLGTKETGEDFQDVRPITPPEDKMKKPSRPAQERKLIITGDTDLWMKKLFDRVKPEGHKDQGSIRRGSRQKKVTIPTKVHITNSKAIVSGEDPYLVDTIADKYLPHLSLDNKNGYGGTSSLQLVTLREGDKSVTLPSLSVEQNYSQMLTELVMNI